MRNNGVNPPLNEVKRKILPEGQVLIFIAGHQPHYLPWLGYFNKIYQSDKFCLVDSIQFNKKWFQNRNKIRTNVGEVLLTVPVKTSGKYYQKISEVEIDNSIPWRRKHWKTMALAYQKAPYFKTYAPFFEDVYRREWTMLVDLNEFILRGLLGFFDIQKEIVRSSNFNPEGGKTDLLIDICKKTGANGYLSGTGKAHSYVVEEKFKEAGLLHKFQIFEHPTYPQIHGGFVGHMAAIDLLFNCGPESGEIIKKACR